MPSATIIGSYVLLLSANEMLIAKQINYVTKIIYVQKRERIVYTCLINALYYNIHIYQ